MAKRPSIPKSDPTAAKLFHSLLPDDTRVIVRPMFGHTAAFVGGHMFAGTFGPQVFVRLDAQARADLLSIGGARPFAPMKGRPMKEYVELPPLMLTEPTRAKAWIQRALDWTSALPPKAADRGAVPPRNSKTTMSRTRARQAAKGR
jgi:TfoX/Sxy family transcriptional regulator of competence genes